MKSVEVVRGRIEIISSSREVKCSAFNKFWFFDG
jgi:hypothetical protein